MNNPTILLAMLPEDQLQADQSQDALDDLVTGLKSREASKINNEGPHAQMIYIMSQVGLEAVQGLAHDLGLIISIGSKR